MFENESAEDRMKAIQALYTQLPPLTSCKGLCAKACADIDMSELERARIKHRHQVSIKTRTVQQIAHTGPKKCKALKKNGSCGVYEDRPLICRAWGVIDAAPCPFGCVPDDGRYLTDAEYKGLELAVESLGGHWFRTDADRKSQLAFYATEAGRAALAKQMDRARAETLRMLQGVDDASVAGADV